MKNLGKENAKSMQLSLFLRKKNINGIRKRKKKKVKSFGLALFHQNLWLKAQKKEHLLN